MKKADVFVFIGVVIVFLPFFISKIKFFIQNILKIN